MEGNKDEALRCAKMAQEAMGSGNKERALKFIKILKRLDPSLSAEQLLAKCDKLDSGSTNSSFQERNAHDVVVKPSGIDQGVDEGKSENIQLIWRIKRNSDYYAILGVQKNCSVEEIRRAYRKLSLKVHPDKNKAPGSEEAFKKVSKAFTCLSDLSSRRQYDRSGPVDEFGHTQRHSFRQKRQRYERDYFDENFDPDEIFKSFFRQGEMFRPSHAHRARGTGNQHRNEFYRTGWGEEFHGTGPSVLTLLQILPFLLILLLAYLPFPEPDYSLHKNNAYQIPKTTERHGIGFYVKSAAFDEKFPHGSPSRANIEDSVIKDYRSFLFHSCRVELQKRRWNKNMLTPHCNKLQDLGFVGRMYG